MNESYLLRSAVITLTVQKLCFQNAARQDDQTINQQETEQDSMQQLVMKQKIPEGLLWLRDLLDCVRHLTSLKSP